QEVRQVRRSKASEPELPPIDPDGPDLPRVIDAEQTSDLSPVIAAMQLRCRDRPHVKLARAYSGAGRPQRAP
ncbi:hypothetical protein RSW78_26720, partial [Escherichia coli]